MSKKKSTKKRPPSASAEKSSPPGSTSHVVREGIESIVIALVLAFLFRAFEAEAFVIPTGSMSPSLQGQHKDVDCSECGYRFLTTASTEGEDRDAMIAQLRNPRLDLQGRESLKRRIAGVEVLAGVCPMCRQMMAFRSDLPLAVPDYVNLASATGHTSYPGDRILVNKFIYGSQEPKRWEVIVFKYPGNGTMNYIKRLVGLPGETLRIFQGDLFTRKRGDEGEFQIARKPPHVVRAMLQTVHDTDHEPASLYNTGWPLRWSAATGDGWQVDAEPGQQVVKQTFSIDAVKSATTAWLRYRHLLPQNDQWSTILSQRESGLSQRESGLAQREAGKPQPIDKKEFAEAAKPQLIRDFNAYNARKLRGQLYKAGWEMPEHVLGMHWVGDLAMRCQVEVQQTQGELILDLVEAGKHFSCRIDLHSGQATLGIEGLEGFSPSATTPLDSPGSYELLLSNIDDQLLLWVDGKRIDFGDSTYDAGGLHAGRKNALPKTAETDLGDLSPAGVGAHNASLKITRLEVLRDIYYLAVRWNEPNKRSDYKDMSSLRSPQDVKRLFTDPSMWSIFSSRRQQEFEIDENQFFVMGDNSPESLDCRLWKSGNGSTGSIPGGPYLDRQLLIGKAVCVFWPHSWGGVPGIKQLPGFPNFGDIRLVR